jgi:O-antigen ligase
MIPQADSSKVRNWFTGLLIAAPVFAFPFSKIYTAFFIIILISACIHWRSLIQSKSQKPLLLGIVAIAVPICITGFALPLLGVGWSSLWLKKLSTVLLAGIFGLATMTLIKEQPDSVGITKKAVSATVLFWIFDGIIQLIFGQDLFGAPLNNGRVGIFATDPLDFAYYFPLFAVFPIIHFYGLSGNAKFLLSPKLSSFLVLGFSIIITFSGGCRNSMLLIGLISIGWAATLIRELRSQYRRLVIPSFLGAFVLIGILFYKFNAVFQQRFDQTIKILTSPSYKQVNQVLSGRLDIWQPASEILQANTIFGIGPNQFRGAVLNILRPGNYYYQNSDFIMHAHQVLIEVALGTGIIGLACFLIYYIYTAKYFFARRELLNRSKGFGLAGTLAFLLLWFPLGTHYNIYGSMQLFYSFYFLALGFATSPSWPDRQVQTDS